MSGMSGVGMVAAFGRHVLAISKTPAFIAATISTQLPLAKLLDWPFAVAPSEGVSNHYYHDYLHGGRQACRIIMIIIICGICLHVE